MASNVTSSPLFLGSAALNIFLAAFILGRLSGAPDMPPRFMHGDHHGFEHDRGGDRMQPPQFKAGDLFTDKEREDNLAAVKANFDEAQKLRESFAAKLKQGPVTKDEVLAHFAEMDKFMDQAKSTMQAKAADKISAMKDDERQKFSEHLLENHMPPMGVPGLPPPGEMGGPDRDGHGRHGPDDRGPGFGPDHQPDDQLKGDNP